MLRVDSGEYWLQYKLVERFPLDTGAMRRLHLGKTVIRPCCCLPEPKQAVRHGMRYIAGTGYKPNPLAMGFFV